VSSRFGDSYEAFSCLRLCEPQGDVGAAGLHKPRSERLVTEKLSDRLRDPIGIVSVHQEGGAAV
jgi:hypothetical protein